MAVEASWDGFRNRWSLDVIKTKCETAYPWYELMFLVDQVMDQSDRLYNAIDIVNDLNLDFTRFIRPRSRKPCKDFVTFLFVETLSLMLLAEASENSLRELNIFLWNHATKNILGMKKPVPPDLDKTLRMLLQDKLSALNADYDDMKMRFLTMRNSIVGQSINTYQYSITHPEPRTIANYELFRDKQHVHQNNHLLDGIISALATVYPWVELMVLVTQIAKQEHRVRYSVDVVDRLRTEFRDFLSFRRGPLPKLLALVFIECMGIHMLLTKPDDCVHFLRHPIVTEFAGGNQQVTNLPDEVRIIMTHLLDNVDYHKMRAKFMELKRKFIGRVVPVTYGGRIEKQSSPIKSSRCSACSRPGFGMPQRSLSAPRRLSIPPPFG